MSRETAGSKVAHFWLMAQYWLTAHNWLVKSIYSKNGDHKYFDMPLNPENAPASDWPK